MNDQTEEKCGRELPDGSRCMRGKNHGDYLLPCASPSFGELFNHRKWKPRNSVWAEPYPVVYGALDLKGTLHGLQWLAQQPFRPSDLLLWGVDSTTYLDSFTIGLHEQLVQPIPFLQVLRSPWFALEQLTAHLMPAVPNAALLDGVKLRGHLSVRVNPGLVFETASPGTPMRMRVRGSLKHAIVYGVSL